jgi:hypothetical protein
MGRPKGSTNDRLWRDAMRKAALDRAAPDRPQYIEEAARAVVAAAVAGDLAAAKELGDRLDGRATQPIEHSGHLDIAMTLDRVITEMRERELSMRLPQVEDAVRH